jgi:putative tricarboxylic transport membrane protein
VVSVSEVFVATDLLLQANAQTGELGEAIRIAFDLIVDPVNFGLVVVATLLGLILGIFPGLGGAITLALLIPVTFSLDTNVSIMILAAALGGTNFGGSVTAILLNTPGAAPNAATVLDGYPLAREAKGGMAIAASAVSSAGGALLGLLILLLSVPFIRPVTLAFGVTEFFWLAVLGLTIIAVATTGSVLNDLIAGGVGLLVGFHGFSSVTGLPRFTFELNYLQGGIPLIPVLIGLFAIAEMINLVGGGDTIAQRGTVEGGRIEGIVAVVRNWKTFLQSAMIGWTVGVIPGVGGTVANFISYLQAKQRDSDPDSFGKGNIKGVIASEASNDAKDGGSMLPTLGLGIPGSASTAVLLGAFVLQGVTPGPLLFQENLQILFIITFALIISNILTSAVGLLSAEYLAKLTEVDIASLAPVVIVVSLLGAFVFRNSFGDVVIAVIFGLIGFLMMKFDFSRISVIIALVLGTLAERSFTQSLQISRGDYGVFVSRPLSVLLIAICIGSLLLPVYRARAG